MTVAKKSTKNDLVNAIVKTHNTSVESNTDNKAVKAVQKRRATAAAKTGIQPPTKAELTAMDATPTKRGAGFEKGTGAYACKSCTRLTRSTGKGDNENVLLCAQCWEIAGIENQILDGDFDGPAGKRKLQLEIQDYQNIIIAKGGKIKKADLIVVDPVPVAEQLKASIALEPPVTPLTKLLTSKGFIFAQSAAVDEQNTAHGYSHEDGSAAMFIHANISTNIGVRWTLVRADGTKIEGKTAKELAVALVIPKPLPNNVVSALDMLRKVTKTSYDVATLHGDKNYTTRVQLLKKLRNTDKVLAKESGVNHIFKALYAALKVDTPAQLIERCFELYRVEQKADRAVVRVEKAEVKEQTKQSGGAVLVHDSKPVLPVAKKLGRVKQQELDEQNRVDLAAQIARKRREEEYTPLAVPRPEATIAVNLDDVCLLEDPDNGIVLICLEKPNSQGAICVYNNGSRVAAGVLPTEELIRMRSFPSEDLVRDINHFLHPITSGVSVTPVADSHLTAVLMVCKEKLDMATATAVSTKKFAAPKNATAAKPNGKVEKAARTAKTPKVARAASEGHKRSKFADDAKITILVKDNPYREASRAHASYEAIKKSKTVGAFKELCQAEDTKTKLAPKFTYLAWSMEAHGDTPALVKVA